MNYAHIRQRPTQFESVTSLKIEEFDYLSPLFSERWIKFYRHFTIEGKRRKAPIFNPSKGTRSLPSVDEKLFFVLVYVKNHALQEMTAASSGFSQSQASKWQKVLKPLFFESLKELGMLPQRDGSKVGQMLESLGEEKAFHDATERPVNRPADPDTQEEFYSGKKKPTP